MKKIGKLSINPEKVIKNEELVNLRGGYNGDCIYCIVYWDSGERSYGWACDCGTDEQCEAQILDMYPAAYGVDCTS